jgi:GDP-fucose protein O-fucosyltransferase
MQQKSFWIFCILTVFFAYFLNFLLTEYERNYHFYHPELMIKTMPFPFYNDSLEALCDSTVWNPNLFLNCTNIFLADTRYEEFGDAQGLMNLKNSIMSCLRHAIDGGMNFVMPRIAVRSEMNIKYFTKYGNFSFLFDEDNFRQMLNKKCPQLGIYDSYYNVSNVIITPRDNQRRPYTINGYRRHAYEVLESHNINIKSNNIPPTVIWENKPFMGWWFYREGDVTRKVLYDAISFQPRFTEFGSKLVTLMPNRYIGFHLRVEPDALWYTYDQLMTWFIDICKTNYSDINNVYLSVGSQELENKTRKDLSRLNMTVHTKWSLVASSEELQAELDTFKFDQQAIVDYQVMLDSDVFFGVKQSSFSYNIALDRGNGNLQNCMCHSFNGLDLGFQESF